MSVVRVTVKVYEDDEEVGTLAVSYYKRQDYHVDIVTPDGTDARTTRTAGEPIVRKVPA